MLTHNTEGFEGSIKALKALQPLTRDGAFSSASRFTSFDPAWQQNASSHDTVCEKNLPSVLALCLAVAALSGCTTWPYHTSESSLADKIFLPSELDARTKHYEKKGMSYWDARRRAYSETDSKERWYYHSEAEELRSKEITRDDLKRVP